MKPPKLYKRVWLNREGLGCVEVIGAIDVYTPKNGKTSYSGDCGVVIRDCSRSVSLEFYYNNEKEYQVRLKKIRTMIETLESLEQYMLDNPISKYSKNETPLTINDIIP